MAGTDDAHDDALPIAEPTVLWSDERLLGHAAMDRVHADSYGVVLDLLTCTEATVVDTLAAFQDHAVAQVLDAWRAGRIGLDVVHDLATHLFHWFPGHADTMDSALAAWLTRQQHGGQPVVLRRRCADAHRPVHASRADRAAR